jgi:hypothetical protein
VGGERWVKESRCARERARDRGYYFNQKKNERKRLKEALKRTKNEYQCMGFHRPIPRMKALGVTHHTSNKVTSQHNKSNALSHEHVASLFIQKKKEKKKGVSMTFFSLETMERRVDVY